jgi:hypothetical protein
LQGFADIGQVRQGHRFCQSGPDFTSIDLQHFGNERRNQLILLGETQVPVLFQTKKYTAYDKQSSYLPLRAV